MSYTRLQWSTGLLMDIGNKNPSPDVLYWLIAWTMCETSITSPSPSYNLLNTTEPNTPGVVKPDFNSIGVKNYDSFVHGIQANSKVLQNGFYPDILTGLKTNNISLLKTGTNINKELSTWGTGNVQVHINSIMGMGLNESFPGSASTSLVNPPPMWTKIVSDIRYDTGISRSWLKNAIAYGSPVTPEMEVRPNSMLVVQEFEQATCFWINGQAHWRIYR